MSAPGNCPAILTFALGHYSSHVATHFFNIQEASFSYNHNFSTGINHDALFRENSHSTNATYTPRLIIVDDADALGFLSKDGIYRSSNNIDGDSPPQTDVIVKKNSRGKNNFLNDYIQEKQSSGYDFIMKNSYNLDGDVASWSDYLITEFNDKTIVTLPTNSEYYESYDKFSNFQSGFSLWQKSSLHEEIEENTRFFMEEIDNFQGFQVLFDGDNGYSGIGSSCLEFLSDEYNKKTIFAIPALYSDSTKTHDPHVEYRKRGEKIYSLSSSLAMSSQFCDIVAPMSHLLNPWGKKPEVRNFNNIKFQPNLMYHTSAILASALDLFTLPYRLLHKSSSMHEVAANLNIYGRNIATVGLHIPLPLSDRDPLKGIEKANKNLFYSLTPLIEVIHEKIDVQYITAKGYAKFQKNEDPELSEQLLKSYLNQMFPRVFSSFSSCKSCFRVPRTFPKIFDENFNLSPSENSYGPLAEYAAIGGLHNSREMTNVLKDLHDEAKLIKIRKIPGFGASDSEIDYTEVLEDLENLSYKYSDLCFL